MASWGILAILEAPKPMGNTLNRRNLTGEQQTYLTGKLYNESKKPHGGNRKNPEKQGKKSSPQNEDLKTSEAIAEQHGVSKATVERAANFAKGVDMKEERDAAVQCLFLQAFTQPEIADAVGMPQASVNALLSEIQNFKIPIIPGLYTEVLADKAGKSLKEAETERQNKIKSSK